MAISGKIVVVPARLPCVCVCVCVCVLDWFGLCWAVR